MDRYARTYTVRWADCDANGHMRNTAYSEYATETRVAFLADQGFGFERFRELAFGPVILREEIDYLREVHLGDRIEIDLVEVGGSADRSRFKWQHEIVRDDRKLVARVAVVAGWLDWSSRRLMPPPDALRPGIAVVPRAVDWEELPSRGRRE